MATGLQQSVTEYLEGLVGKAGPAHDLLTLAEKKTGLRRSVLVGGLGVGLMAALVVGYAAQLLSGLIGFLYPAYYSVRALSTNQKAQETR